MHGMTAKDIITTLGLQQHPEGGWYVETFRDENGAPRGHSSAIYYMLQAGERSQWHRVRDAAEVWHFYAGAPMLLKISRGGDIENIRLGTNLSAGQRPQAVVPADAWQAAESLGAFTLVGCTVAPGFEFASFEMAPPDWNPTTRA